MMDDPIEDVELLQGRDSKLDKSDGDKTFKTARQSEDDEEDEIEIEQENSKNSSGKYVLDTVEESK